MKDLTCKNRNLKVVRLKLKTEKQHCESWNLPWKREKQNLENIAPKIESWKVKVWKLESEKQKRYNFAVIRNFD